MAAGGTSSISLEYTPAWAIAIVSFIIIFISFFLERSIHLLISWLESHRKIALRDAVERLKSELMLLGFMSLFLAVIREPISHICIPTRVAYTMLPCRTTVQDEAAAAFDSCHSEGMTALMTQNGIHQLHIFIFVLAIMQIVYSVLTMALGRAKMRRWKAWERETHTIEYEIANDAKRFRLARETTFVSRHMSAHTDCSVQVWMMCFFRQFFHSVAKVDYLTLRHGFISAHMQTKQNTFNFQKYIKRSLQEDFTVIVSVSPPMWLVVVVLFLLDAHGWSICYWVAYVPLLLVLVLGAKLEVIVTKMAFQIENRNRVLNGTPLVQPDDRLFWFGKPKFVLALLHFTLFMNAFNMAFFIWVSIQFGLRSCFQENIFIIISRVVIPVAVQVLCSYITLPLYALVTQMGSQINTSSVLDERIARVLKQWHMEVREKRKMRTLSAQPMHAPFLVEWSPRTSLPFK